MDARSPARSFLMLLHYWWPLALGWSVTAVVHRATVRTGNPVGVTVLLLGILAVYSLDRASDAYPAWMHWTLILVGIGSSGAGGMLLWRLPMQTAVLVPVLGVIALTYPFVKKWPYVKAIAVPVVWTWGTVALPFNDGSWFGWRWLLVPVSIPLVLLIAAGCLLCDLKDEARDRRSGVSSLPVILGATATGRVALALAIAGGVCAWLQNRMGLAIGAPILGLSSLWPSLLAEGPLGALLVDVILTLPGVLVSLHIV